MYNLDMTLTKKKIFRNLIIVFLVLSIFYWTAVNVLVSAVLVPSFMERLESFERIARQSYAEQIQESDLQKNAAAMRVIGKSWAQNTDTEEVEIISDDGYRLIGAVFYSRKPAAEMNGRSSHRWVILLHGFTGSKEMMYGYAYWYVRKGINVLAPDFRCQGESEGDYIGLGATDSTDLLRWIDMILQKDPEAEVVLHGLSMGASTALILTGRDDAPSCIKAVISDCAYTDAYSMFREKIGSWFHLPAFPVVDSARLMIRLRAGYDLKEASPLKAVKKSKIPTLFMHGQEDRMIPVEMCHALYDDAACEKDIMIVGGAGHAQAVDKDPAAYYEKIAEFLHFS